MTETFSICDVLTLLLFLVYYLKGCNKYWEEEMKHMNFLTNVTNSAIVWMYVALLFSFIPMLCGGAKLLSKADEPWWKILIPFYGMYKVHAIADSAIVFWSSILALLINILAIVVHDGYMWVSWLISVASIILHVAFSFNLANAFGKSRKFACGLVFLPPVFMCILGFGNAYHVETVFRHRYAS